METRQIQPKYDENYGVEFFYENFPGKYSPSDFGLKGKRKVQLPLPVYQNIISEYFDIYMKELYFMQEPKYFLFGGIARICRTVTTMKRIKKDGKLVFNKKNTSIVIFWSSRPSKLFAACVKLVKLTGGGNRAKMPKIEKLFRLNFDVELLPKFEVVIEQAIKNKNLFQ